MLKQTGSMWTHLEGCLAKRLRCLLILRQGVLSRDDGHSIERRSKACVCVKEELCGTSSFSKFRATSIGVHGEANQQAHKKVDEEADESVIAHGQDHTNSNSSFARTIHGTLTSSNLAFAPTRRSSAVGVGAIS